MATKARSRRKGQPPPPSKATLDAEKKGLRDIYTESKRRGGTDVDPLGRTQDTKSIRYAEEYVRGGREAYTSAIARDAADIKNERNRVNKATKKGLSAASRSAAARKAAVTRKARGGKR